MRIWVRTCSSPVDHSTSIRVRPDDWPRELAQQRGTLISGRTFAKYLQMVSEAAPRSWLNGHAMPAWQAPCRKNLHGTCDVSEHRAGDGPLKLAHVTRGHYLGSQGRRCATRRCLRVAQRQDMADGSQKQDAVRPRASRSTGENSSATGRPGIGLLGGLLGPSNR